MVHAIVGIRARDRSAKRIQKDLVERWDDSLSTKVGAGLSRDAVIEGFNRGMETRSSDAEISRERGTWTRDAEIETLGEVGVGVASPRSPVWHLRGGALVHRHPRRGQLRGRRIGVMVAAGHQLQNSIPSWPFTPARKGCLTRVISVTRSAASISSGLALRPVTTTWRSGRLA
jgi:hypothetical protein